jgi:hypothetical protein
MKLLLSILIPAALLGQTRGTSVSNSDFSINTPASVTLPPWNVAAGGTIVGCARFSNSLTTTISVTDTGSANRFSVTNYANVGASTRVAMFKAENTVAVAADVLQIAFSSGGTAFTAEAAVQYSGTAPSSYDTGAIGITASGTSVTSGAFTTSQGPEIAVACATTPGTSVIPGSVGTTPMSIAAADSPGGYVAIEDANLYQVQTGVTASMSNASFGQGWGLVAGTFKSSNPVSPPLISEAIGNLAASVGGVPYMYVGESATVSFTITNTNSSSSLSGIVFSDTLPAGMVVATPNGVTGSCPGGSIDAAAGTGTISLSGASLPAAASCTFSVNFTSVAAGTGVNTTGNVTASESRNGGTATATVRTYGTPAVTIGNITVKAVDHASVNITYSTSVPGFCQLQFGLASGTYTHSGGSAPTYLNTCALSIGGLAPLTTYYVMPTARPDANDAIGLCQIGGNCGSTEQIFTTLALPPVHPAPPNPPSVWTPVEPVTTGYTVVPMQASPSDSTCVAASTVAKQTNWSSAVTTGDSLQTIVNEIWFDTVIEFPEGSSCGIPQDNGGFHTGVTLPQYSPNGGANDWVVFRTHANAASDLPPFGVRTGPQFASKLATLVAQTPGMPLAPGSATQNFNGQIFDCYQNGCNHFWIENVAMTHAFNTTLYPPGGTDPPAFVDYVRFVPQCVFSPNIGCSIDSPATAPSYMVLDRVYAYGQPWPSREMGCFVPGGNHWALINNYCITNFWVPSPYLPEGNPVSSGASILIPHSTFQFNAFDNTPIGMTTPAGYAGTSTTPLTLGAGVQTIMTQPGLSYRTGDPVELLAVGTPYSTWMIGTVNGYNGNSMAVNVTAVNGSGSVSSWVLESPAVATLTAPAGYTGSVYAWIGSSGLTIDYQAGAGVSLSCTNCTATSQSMPSRTSVPATSLYYFNGHFSNGSFVLDASTPWNFYPSLLSAFRPLGIYLYPGQYGVFDNNYIQAIGQTVYNDSYGPVEDISWTHNYFYFPRSKMQNSGQWDGYGYSFRNVIESKQQLRGQYVGNIIDGSASYQNPGNAIFLAGAYGGPYSTGTQDINISSNVFKHLSSGFDLAGGGTSPGPPDAPQASRIAITNNLWLDLNRDIYNNGGGGLASGAFSTYPMGSDINFSNNTLGLTKGSGPSLLYVGGASLPQTTVMGEGLVYSNNVVLASLGGADVIASIDGGQNAAYSNFPTNPTVPAGVAAPSPAGTWEAYLDGNFIHTGASVTPSWSMGNNVLIGAVNNRAGGGWVDASRSDISSYLQSLWPASDTTSRFPCSSIDTHCSGGTTLASRLTAVGWSPTMNLAGGNPNPYAIVPGIYNPGNVGANVTTVNQATGVVQAILVNKGPTSVTFSYAAPDIRACSVDVSPDGMTWSRMTDSGGAFSRSQTFTGLAPNTTYQYRIMCYFDQSAAYEFLSSQITSGSVTTAANIATTVFQTFTLPPGASKAVFAFAAPDGTTVHQTCSSSPCSVNLSSGSWTRTLAFETDDSVAVGTTSATRINVP